jgi:hypothetical protein
MAAKLSMRRLGTLSVLLLAVACSSSDPGTTDLPAAKALDPSDYFDKRVDVFGVPFHATASAPDEKLLHAASVLAQYLDNDADGSPDNASLIAALVENDARLFMAVDRDELDEVFDRIEAAHPGTMGKTAWWLNPDGITVPDSVWQDLQSEETVLLEDRGEEFDGALEEVLHLISHVGLANAHPEAFAEAPGSRLADAMDTVRGGRFEEVPERYPDDALYSYYDETCVYQCQAAEYLYWALTSLLGGQAAAERLEEIGEEWRLNTPEKLASGNPEVYALLTDPAYSLPTVLPDGRYEGAPLEIVGTQGDNP